VSSLDPAAGNVATFTTGATVPAGNVILAIGATTGNVVYDLVSVDATAIPEPSSMAMILLAGLGVFRRRH
ncbi:MAG: PEP-CTERM sorting domain-containing protein, partial [Akkermansiaceae bacterium]|nr:PEP-CTERM sorting domain-containing protein [Akkermansiaceae bacterium]